MRSRQRSLEGSFGRETPRKQKGGCAAGEGGGFNFERVATVFARERIPVWAVECH